MLQQESAAAHITWGMQECPAVSVPTPSMKSTPQAINNRARDKNTGKDSNGVRERETLENLTAVPTTPPLPA